MEDLFQNMWCMIYPSACFHVFVFLLRFKMPAVKYGSQFMASDWLLLWRLNQSFQMTFEFLLILTTWLVQNAGCESEGQNRRQQIVSVTVSIMWWWIHVWRWRVWLIVKGSVLNKTFCFLPPVGVLRMFLLSFLRISCCLVSLIVALPADNCHCHLSEMSAFLFAFCCTPG